MQNVKIIILTKKDLKTDSINLAVSEVEFVNAKLSRKDRSQAHIIVFQEGIEVKILKSLYYSEDLILSLLSSRPYIETEAELKIGKAIYAPITPPRTIVIEPEDAFMFTGGSRKLSTFREKVQADLHYDFLTEKRRLLTFSEPE